MIRAAMSAEDTAPVPRPRSRSIYLLPNLLTTGCLFSGFYAVIAAIDGNAFGNPPPGL